jgi:hypothetical protein
MGGLFVEVEETKVKENKQFFFANKTQTKTQTKDKDAYYKKEEELWLVLIHFR